MRGLLGRATPAATAALLFTVGVVSPIGCVPALSNSNVTPVAVPVRAGDVHDVAILSVEFSPPSLESGPQREPTLLVAVDNRGRVNEERVVIETRMTGDEGDLIAEAREVIADLAPGEVRVVRFAPPALELNYPRYLLQVQIASVEGERLIANNFRSLRVDLQSHAWREE